MIVRHLQKALPWVSRARDGWQTAAVSTSTALFKPERPEPVPISKLYDNFLDGTSSTYLEELERKYQSDPNSVDKSWGSFFSMAGMAAKPCELIIRSICIVVLKLVWLQIVGSSLIKSRKPFMLSHTMARHLSHPRFQLRRCLTRQFKSQCVSFY